MTGHTTSLAVSASNVTKAFGRTMALRGVGLELAWGRCLALMGPNGAGKTTLLRVLATLLHADTGQVQVAGFNSREEAARVRAITGFLGQQSLLYRELTVRENLRFYAGLYRVVGPERRISQLLEEMGAAGWRDRRVGTLSSGMQKRVALARALLHQPRLLVLDEPESGLDEQGRTLLSRVVQDSVNRGAAVVMTTHNTAWGLRLAHQIAVLAEGRIVLHKPSDAVEPSTLQRVLNQDKSSPG